MLPKIKSTLERLIFSGDLLLPLPFWKKLIFYGSFLAFALLTFFHQTRTLGKVALILLTIVIYTKPLVKLFPTIGFFKSLLVLRRSLGQASAFAVIAHVLAQVFPRLSLTDLLTFAATSQPSYFLFWGFWGLVLILPLLITSNDLSTHLLKRKWFLLQKLIHPLYIFSMIHFALQKSLSTQIFVIFVLIVLYGSRYLATRGIRFSTPSLVL